MYYSHYGHLLEMKVRVGDNVKKGQVIGKMGGTPKWVSHLHFEIRLQDFPAGYYPKTSSFKPENAQALKEEILQKYADPLSFIKEHGLADPCVYDAYGYRWLEWADYGSFRTFHPGEDLNRGYGDQDKGDNIYSVADGVVKYAIPMAANPANDDGWGNHIVIEHNQEVKVSENDTIREMLPGLKINEFRIDGSPTVYQIFGVPDTHWFEDILGNKWENIRVLPSDWPLDPKDWAGQRDILIPALNEANRQIGELKSQLENANTGKMQAENMVKQYIDMLEVANTAIKDAEEQLTDSTEQNKDLQNQLESIQNTPEPEKDAVEPCEQSEPVNTAPNLEDLLKMLVKSIKNIIK